MDRLDDYKYKDKLLIIGAGGHGRVTADIALKMNRWQEIAFLDDNDSLAASMGIRVMGNSSDVYRYLDEYDIFVAIGDNLTRELILSQLETEGASIPILIHPSAVIGTNVDIGAGTVVMAGVVINCCSRIGKGCIINTGATIDHDNIIENYVHISPGVNTAGCVHIGKSTWIGIGAIISNNVKIISGCTIGAGAVVVKNINKVGKYVGIPASILKERQYYEEPI